jgi:toxin ParE1/3/4
MTRRLVFLQGARANIRDISDFVTEASGSEDVAESFVAHLVERCQRLASLPGLLGTPRFDLRADVRSTPHGSYVIFFRYVDDSLEIVNVLHGGRDLPNYFRGEE